MARKTYNVDQEVIIRVRFYDEEADPRALADPTDVTLQVEGGGIEETYTLAQLDNPQVGVYEKRVTPSAPGKVWHRGVGTGAVRATVEDYFLVKDGTLG